MIDALQTLGFSESPAAGARLDHYGHMGGYGMGGFMWIWPLLMIGLVVLLVVLIARPGRHDTPAPPTAASPTAPHPLDSARKILGERLASGDIDVKDYRARMNELDGS